MEHVLDNPVWNALISGNKHFSKGNDQVKFFPQNISFFAGMELYGPAEFSLLHSLVPFGRNLAILVREEITIPAIWKATEHVHVLQMVNPHPGMASAPSIKPVGLGEKDVPQMIALARLTHPGPFFKKTVNFGNYEGIFVNDKLVSMAGQRLKAGPFTEISAVCTHPAHLGKAYAANLLISQLEQIHAASRVPFLHVRKDNARAIRLYESLGFGIRKQMEIYLIKKI